MKNASKIAAIGGVTAALAVVVMCMGTLIPVATYVCPMICALILQAVLKLCGSRAAWAWYAAVSLLCALMSPDKEAAAVFIFLGYYPIVKPRLDAMRFSLLWKLILFHLSVGLMYGALIFLFGMGDIYTEFREAGMVMGIITWLLGIATFLLLDNLLSRASGKRRH